MADIARPIAPVALGLAGLLAALTLGTAAALALRADGFALRPGDWAALRFTLWQAALSSLTAALLAVPVARALARRRFAGRGVLVALMGLPFVLPVLVAVLGLLALFGRMGMINQALTAMHLPPISIFGLHGVVLAHVFLNLPLAVRMLLAGWEEIPAERFRLAQSLGLGPRAQHRHLEMPMLRATLPGVALLIFLLCLTSFAVALTLGGGPAATTVELAIYQALRFDFDLGRAATLAMLQFATCAIAALIAGRLALPAGFGAGQDRTIIISGPTGWRAIGDGICIALAAAFLILPLGAVVADGAAGIASLPVSVWWAALRSLAMALAATLLATTAALTLALAVAANGRGARWLETAAMLPLAASGLVLGTGLFIGLFPFARPETLAVTVTVLVNAVMALPFVFRLVLPQAQSLDADYARLSATLGLRGWHKLRWITLPRLARPLGFGAGVAAALAMGDLGVIALFAGEGNATLPLMVQRLMGAYRMQDAAAAALLLVAISFGLFWALDRIGRHAGP